MNVGAADRASQEATAGSARRLAPPLNVRQRPSQASTAASPEDLGLAPF